MEKSYGSLCRQYSDILVIAMHQEMEHFKASFVEEFQWITMEIGKPHSYLGMQLQLYNGFLTVDMIHFIEKMLADIMQLKQYKTPAAKDIFTVNEKAVVLHEKEQKQFHT